MRNTLILYVVLMVCITNQFCNAQSFIPRDTNLERDYQTEIKSVDEFLSRFNGLEGHPDIKEDSLYFKNNIISLFDIDKFKTNDAKLNESNKNLINSFCDIVLNQDIRLEISNPGLFALLKCKVKFKNKISSVMLVMKQENTKDGFSRWYIASVSGLIKSGIINASDRLYNYSPVEHEIYFMGLDDILNQNRSKVFGYRGIYDTVNQQSIFLSLIQLGMLDLVGVDSLEFVCIDVPGFIFKISENIKESSNSGWLINELIQCDDAAKLEYINNLMNEI